MMERGLDADELRVKRDLKGAGVVAGSEESARLCMLYAGDYVREIKLMDGDDNLVGRVIIAATEHPSTHGSPWGFRVQALPCYVRAVRRLLEGRTNDALPVLVWRV